MTHYIAKDADIYVQHPTGALELFITVYPTDTGGTVTPEEQAKIIADLLNREFG